MFSTALQGRDGHCLGQIVPSCFFCCYIPYRISVHDLCPILAPLFLSANLHEILRMIRQFDEKTTIKVSFLHFYLAVNGKSRIFVRKR